jgi:rhamnogalacturonan acetylesterase
MKTFPKLNHEAPAAESFLHNLHGRTGCIADEILKKYADMNPKHRDVSYLFSFFLICLAGCVSAHAQKESTPTGGVLVYPQDAPTMDIQHDTTSYQSGFDMDTNRAMPILFIVGDSTVHNFSGGRVGWGDVIGKYFDTNKIRVENHALAGRSSRTFITQGWWNKIMAAAKPGDYVLIQMGHNDSGPINDTNRARGTIHGIGDEQKLIYNPITQSNEIVHTYGWYMRKYVSDARAKGMTGLICSPVPHAPKSEVKPGEIEKSDYVGFAGEVATNQSVTFINLNRLVLQHFAGIPPESIKEKYYARGETTHFNAVGAELNARTVVDGLEASDSPLKQFLLK